MDHPALPQELQDSVVDANAGDTPTLQEISLVNSAWRARSYRYLFSSLAIRAAACRPGVATLDEFDTNGIRDFLPNENPTRTFQSILATIPHSFDNNVTALVLRAASLEERLKYAALGIRLVKPELDACTVASYVDRYPKLASLEIEDVDWVDCPGTDTSTDIHCNCMQSYTSRPFSTLAFRRISHVGTSSNVTFLMQMASSIKELIMEGVIYDESFHPPYDTVPVNAFTLGISRQPWGDRLPELGQSTLRCLRLSPITWREIETVHNMVEAHCKTLEEFHLRIWWYGNSKLPNVCMLRRLTYAQAPFFGQTSGYRSVPDCTRFRSFTPQMLLRLQPCC